VTGSGVAAGAAMAAAWLVLFGLLGSDLAGYARWTLFAGAVAWLISLLLVKAGDRGVAAGIAIVTAGGWSIAVAALAARWTGTGDWPLW
jgi:hypothetical protein